MNHKKRKSDKRTLLFLWGNVLLPLAAGMLLYLWLDPEILIFRTLSDLFSAVGSGLCFIADHVPMLRSIADGVPLLHSIAGYVPMLRSIAGYVPMLRSIAGYVPMLHSIVRRNSPLLRFIRNYGLDMLWSYALVFALYGLLIIDSFKKNTAHLWMAFSLAASLAVFMEGLQLTSLAGGTFDLCDVLVEVLAEAAAVFIIYKHLFYHKF